MAEDDLLVSLRRPRHDKFLTDKAVEFEESLTIPRLEGKMKHGKPPITNLIKLQARVMA